MCLHDVIKDLCCAIKKNDVKTVRDIVKKNPAIVKNANSSDDSGLPQITQVTPLWEAMLCGHKEIVKLLIGSGADPNEPFYFEKNKFFGLTFLQCLAMQDYFWSSNKKIAEILIRQGINSKALSDNKKTPLQMSIEHGNIQYVEFLLCNKAKLRNKMKTLLAAPKSKQKEILELLIKYNIIDIKLHDHVFGLNYLQQCIGIAHHSPHLDVDVVEIAKTFLNSGLLINHLDISGQSVLFHAIHLKNFCLISLLVERGADVNIKCPGGIFPLLMAAKSNDDHLAELLLSNGTEINDKSEDSSTAMHTACSYRSIKVINLLILKNANVSLENLKGDTPFSLLRPKKYRENDVPCINLVIKGIAKQRFFNHSSVCEKDIVLIQSHPVLDEFFKICTNELSQMASVEFYQPYSHASVLQMSRNIKKLAKLSKNEEFASNFEANLLNFPCYEEMLEKIWKEAVQVRDQSLIVESKLKLTFGDFCPDVVLRKLAHNLHVNDLPSE